MKETNMVIITDSLFIKITMDDVKEGDLFFDTSNWGGEYPLNKVEIDLSEIKEYFDSLPKLDQGVT